MKKGVTHNSRRESDFIKRMSPKNQEEYIKRFIAACNPEQLIPFIEITGRDRHFRKIEYEIRLPEEKKESGISQSVLSKVFKERERQNDLWGTQRHDWGTWLIILMEEVGEVAQAMQTERHWGKPSDKADLQKELIQAAAVAVAMAEQIEEER